MIPGGVRIFVCSAPVDLRHGFDRLAQTARERVGTDPMSGGALFVFANKRNAAESPLVREEWVLSVVQAIAPSGLRAAGRRRRIFVGAH
jgi:hypothetical protein